MINGIDYDKVMYMNADVGGQARLLLVVSRIYVAWAVYQPYRDLEAGNN